MSSRGYEERGGGGIRKDRKGRRGGREGGSREGG